MAPSSSPQKLQPKPLLTPLRSAVVQNAQRRSESNISVLTLMSANSKLTEFSVPRATSGYASDQTLLIVPFLGTPIARAASPRKCKLHFSNNRANLNQAFLSNNKNVYALEERNTLFSKDPDVRKFDPERLLCNICDKWITLPPDDHLQAVQKWLQHRATCQKSAAAPPSSTSCVCVM
jgi:hypothetical protein